MCGRSIGTAGDRYWAWFVMLGTVRAPASAPLP